MSAPVKARSRIPRPASNHLSPTSVNSIFPASTSILIPLPGQRPNSAFMEGVKEEQSQKNNAKNQSKMMHPPAPQSSAPRAASPETAAPEVQVKTSQPPQPLRGATPPTSDALSPPSAHVPAEDAEDDDTDEGPTQEADEDETVHDLQAYDWTKLEDEYEAAMAQCDEKEKEATEEFKKLANASSGVDKMKLMIC